MLKPLQTARLAQQLSLTVHACSLAIQHRQQATVLALATHHRLIQHRQLCLLTAQLAQQRSLMVHVCKGPAIAHQAIQRLQQATIHPATAHQAILQPLLRLLIAQRVQQPSLMVHVCKADLAQATLEALSSFIQVTQRHLLAQHHLMVTHQMAVMLQQIICQFANNYLHILKTPLGSGCGGFFYACVSQGTPLARTLSA